MHGGGPAHGPRARRGAFDLQRELRRAARASSTRVVWVLNADGLAWHGEQCACCAWVSVREVANALGKLERYERAHAAGL